MVKEYRYRCGYCKYEFLRKYPTTGGGEPGRHSHSKVSDFVRCPRCGNFLKKDDYIKEAE